MSNEGWKIVVFVGLLAAVPLALSTPYLATLGVDRTPQVLMMSKEGRPVSGAIYSADLPETAPIIALFHQGGSNGRGEYGPLIPWLNENGFRAIAWDLRKGGDLYGSKNRTATDADEDAGFCDAWSDMDAAVDFSTRLASDSPLIVWGSSYSGSLVFRAAAEIEGVDAVIAFSPASGGPMADCRAGLYADDVDVPAYVLRPASEMERDSSQTQKAELEAAGVAFTVVENGIHGSSMLVDERTEYDMTPVRAEVMKWLKSIEAVD